MSEHHLEINALTADQGDPTTATQWAVRIPDGDTYPYGDQEWVKCGQAAAEDEPGATTVHRDVTVTYGPWSDDPATSAPEPAGDLREAITAAVLSICDPYVRDSYENASGDRDLLLAWPPGALDRDTAKAVPPTIRDIVDAVSPVVAAREQEAERRGAAMALRALTGHLLRERDRLRPIRQTPGHSWMLGMEDAAREAHVRASRCEAGEETRG